jgi:HMG (high mobility group) box
MNRQETVIQNCEQNAATARKTNELRDDNIVDSMSDKATRISTATLGVPCDAQEVIVYACTAPASTKLNSVESTIKSNQTEEPMPKRNLSAYNLFFQVERENIINGQEGMNYTYENIARVAFRHYELGKLHLKAPRRKHRKTHGKITFAELARAIAKKWKALDPSSKALFIERTNIEKEQYQNEIAEWADKRLQSQPKRETKSAQQQIFKNVTHDTNLGNRNVVSTSQGGTHEDSSVNFVDEMSQQVAVMPIREFRPSLSHDTQPRYSDSTSVAEYVPIHENVNHSETSTTEIEWINPIELCDFDQPQNMTNMSFSFGNYAPVGQVPQNHHTTDQQVPHLLTSHQQWDMMEPPQDSVYAQMSTQMQSYVPAQNQYFASYPTMRETAHPNVFQSTIHPNMFHSSYAAPTNSPVSLNMSSQSQIGQEGKLDENERNEIPRQFNEYNVP